MRKFDNNVQVTKYKVLKEVSILAFDKADNIEYLGIANKIVTPNGPLHRCCEFKEKAIVNERVKIACGGDKTNPNIIEVLDIACDQCSENRFAITEACRGCIANGCKEVCPKDAIVMLNNRAHIDNGKCIECGKCVSMCSFNAISDVRRPCIGSCPVKAIYITPEKNAVIDDEKCIQCGACVYRCPFGAIIDKSQITDVIKALNKANGKGKKKVYAVIAPAIASQYTFATIEQVVTTIKMLGFHSVIEAALGADIIALEETKEFFEHIKNNSFMTNSCCPSFVAHIEKNHPSLLENVSTTVSPMVATAKLIKSTDENAVVVFIGPCTSKKMEMNRSEVKGIVDYVITFEELQAMIDAKDIDVVTCEPTKLDNASFYGRIFARSGGLSEAIKHVVEGNHVDNINHGIPVAPVICSGLKEADLALKMAKAGKLAGNFIEGMACPGGCIGGAASLSHIPKDKTEIDKYGSMAMEKSIKDSLRVMNTEGIDFHRKHK